MKFVLNSFTIDVIFLIFCIIFSLIGYFKGFIKRAYDFLGTILALILSYYLCDIVSRLFTFVSINNLTKDSVFFSMINKIAAFVVLFLIFYIIKKILGIIIKPVLQGIVSFLSLTDFINKLLGFMLSLMEALVISYCAFTLMMTPLMKDGYNLLNNTILAKQVLNIVPDVSLQITDWTQEYKYLLDKSLDLNNEDTILFIIKTYQLGLLNDEQMTTLIENDIKDYIMNEQLPLNENQKDILIDLINKTNLNDSDKLKMKNKVSE